MISILILLVLFPVALRPNAGQGLLILEVSISHTRRTTGRYDSPGGVISSSQRPLPDNTQHSQQTSMPPAGFEPTISAGVVPHTYASDRAVTGTGFQFHYNNNNKIKENEEGGACSTQRTVGYKELQRLIQDYQIAEETLVKF